MSLRRKKWVIASAISVGVLFLALVGLWASGVFKVKTKEGILEPKQTRDGNNLPPPIVVSSNEYDLSGGFRVVHFGKEGTRGLPVLVDTKQKKYFTQVYDLVTGQAITPSLSHEGRIVHLAFSPDGRRVVTASEDKTARLWDAINGQALAPPLQHGDIVLRASFSPDGRRVVTASEDKTARVWDAATGQALTPPLLHGDKVRHASFSPDGRRVVTASEDKTARLWDAATGKEMASLFQHKSGVAHASFSPDGQRVVTAGWDATARLWDAVTGREATPPLQHTSVVRHASFSPDGRRVVTASKDKTARLWDAATGKQVTPPLQHEDGLLRASFSPDGQQVVTSSQDQTARVWDAATGQAVTPPLLHEGPVYCAMFSPDGRRVVTACLNTTWRSLGVANVRLWDVTTGKELKKTTLDPEGDHAAEDEGFVPLFNGKDLTGWKTYPDNPGNWRVDNRILIGRGPTKSLLFTQKNTYRDFHLRAIARINSGGDSGLCFRIPMFDYRKGQVKGKGYEAQINNTTGKGNYPLTGSLMHFPGAAVTNTLVPPGEWFTLEVLAEGHHFIIRIDGKKTVDFIDSKQSYQRGHLAVNVMDPSTVVEFLKIEIKELASAATMASLSEGSVWKGKRTYRKGAWAGATVTYELHISKCDGSKFKGVKFDNGPGRNRGDVEGEIHGDVIAWREHGLSFKGTLRANEIHVRFDGPVGNGWTTEGDGTLTLSK